MKTNSLSDRERYELVLECRSSGLSDYQWCKEHGIAKSTFYKWIARFRQDGYPDLPKPTGQGSSHAPVVQDVVKVDLLGESKCEYSVPFDYSNSDQNGPGPNPHAVVSKSSDFAVEISSGDAVIRIHNNVSPHILNAILQYAGGVR